jgi:hypothetical protein
VWEEAEGRFRKSRSRLAREIWEGGVEGERVVSAPEGTSTEGGREGRQASVRHIINPSTTSSSVPPSPDHPGQLVKRRAHLVQILGRIRILHLLHQRHTHLERRSVALEIIFGDFVSRNGLVGRDGRTTKGDGGEGRPGASGVGVIVSSCIYEMGEGMGRRLSCQYKTRYSRLSEHQGKNGEGTATARSSLTSSKQNRPLHSIFLPP